MSTSETRETAAELRRQVYGKGDATRADLEMLIGRGRDLGADGDFGELLADVAVDVLAHQANPPDYLSEADAGWLMGRLADGGGLATRAEFEMLKALLTHAVSVPPSLTAFAVREVEKAILTGRRDALGGVDHEAGVVLADDVAALRAFAFAPTVGSELHVDKATAEALFDIAHATATADNDEGFADLFAKAIGNYLMGASFAFAPDAASVRGHEAELDRRTSFGSFLGAMENVGGAALVNAWESVAGGVDHSEAIQNDWVDKQLAAAAPVDAGEAKWVIAHLTRGGVLTAAERRLLAFLKEEAPSAPPELTALYGEAA